MTTGTRSPTPWLDRTGRARCGATLRSLRDEADFEQCLALQRLTWGDDFREQVPPTILAISQKVGGVAAGAFEDGRLLGFVYGLSGFRDGAPAHWSHMLAVVPEARGRGVGRDLKLFQRELLEAIGIGVMYWTYDPLIARNASLNLNSLGATPSEYVRDMYGRDTGSEVHSGLGTDRFIVRWELDGDRRRSPPGGPPPEAEATPWGRRAGSRSWVAIPSDIAAVKERDVEAARGWRRRTRRALGELVAAGAISRGVVPGEGADAATWFYVFDDAPTVSADEQD